MNFLEKDLEQIIFDNIQSKEGRDILFDKGLDIISEDDKYIAKRQLRIGNYGIADIVTRSREIGIGNVIRIYELKKDEINLDALLQAIRYYKGVNRWTSIIKGYDYKYRIILIGKSINLKSDWIYLFDFFNTINIDVYTYKYDINGLLLERHDLADYKLNEEGF